METVYIVDTDKAIRDALKTLLESFEIPVKAYADSETFLKAIRTTKNGFVLVEAEMPGLNGLALLQALRSEGNTIPVIFLTENASTSFVDCARRAGAAGVLRKPFVDDDAWIAFSDNSGGRRSPSGSTQILLLELAVEQLLYGAGGLLFIGSVRDDFDWCLISRSQGNDAENGFTVDPVAVFFQVDLRFEAAGRLDQQRRGACMNTIAVLDDDLSLHHVPVYSSFRKTARALSLSSHRMTFRLNSFAE